MSSKKDTTPKSRRRKIAEWGVQLAIAAGAVIALGAWQTRNMVASGEAAPAFSLTDLDGNRVNLSDIGDKRAVFYFFAPWCSVCHAASHKINALREANTPDDLAKYAVGLGWETTDELRQFAEKHDLTVPVLIGDKQTAADYRISAFPSVYILDKTHHISHRLVGYTTELGLRARCALADIL